MSSSPPVRRTRPVECPQGRQRPVEQQPPRSNNRSAHQTLRAGNRSPPNRSAEDDGFAAGIVDEAPAAPEPAPAPEVRESRRPERTERSERTERVESRSEPRLPACPTPVRRLRRTTGRALDGRAAAGRSGRTRVRRRKPTPRLRTDQAATRTSPNCSTLTIAQWLQHGREGGWHPARGIRGSEEAGSGVPDSA